MNVAKEPEITGVRGPETLPPASPSNPPPVPPVSAVLKQEEKEIKLSTNSDLQQPSGPARSPSAALLACNEAMNIEPQKQLETDTCEHNQSRGDTSPPHPESHDDTSSHRKGSTSSSLLPAARPSPALAPVDSSSHGQSSKPVKSGEQLLPKSGLPSLEDAPSVGKARKRKHRQGMEPIPFGIAKLILAVEEVEGERDPKASEEMTEVCGNTMCGAKHVKDETRNGWTKWELDDGSGYRWLCGVCSEAYKEGQYCIYCGQIYTDASENCSVLDGKDWVGCEECPHWVHVDCEAKVGGEKRIRELLETEEYKYRCGECRRKDKAGRKKARPAKSDKSATPNKGKAKSPKRKTPSPKNNSESEKKAGTSTTHSGK